MRKNKSEPAMSKLNIIPQFLDEHIYAVLIEGNPEGLQNLSDAIKLVAQNKSPDNYIYLSNARLSEKSLNIIISLARPE